MQLMISACIFGICKDLRGNFWMAQGNFEKLDVAI